MERLRCGVEEHQGGERKTECLNILEVERGVYWGRNQRCTVIIELFLPNFTRSSPDSGSVLIAFTDQLPLARKPTTEPRVGRLPLSLYGERSIINSP